MDLKATFGTNKKAELEGVWVPLGEGAKLLIARMGNKNYKDATKRIGAPYKLQIRTGKLRDDVNDKLVIEALAEAVLLDWTGVQDDKKTIEYSKENAIALMTKYPDFRDQVLELSNNMEIFQTELEESAAKN